MKRLLFAVLLAGCASAPTAPPELHDIRQLTRDGTHAEAYFSYDGKKLVLMAQRAGSVTVEIDASRSMRARLSENVRNRWLR